MSVSEESISEEFGDTEHDVTESEDEEGKPAAQLVSSWSGSREPLAPYQNVLISEEFLDTNHGEIECERCHNGNPDGREKNEAHQGVVAQPSLDNVENACGRCHPEIVETVLKSLHVTLAPFTETLKARADMKKWKHINRARENHCTACHTSCSGCHVSRPAHIQKGFINGHIFKQRPDLINKCMACHGSRVGSEFTGIRGQGDDRNGLRGSRGGRIHVDPLHGQH